MEKFLGLINLLILEFQELSIFNLYFLKFDLIFTYLMNYIIIILLKF